MRKIYASYIKFSDNTAEEVILKAVKQMIASTKYSFLGAGKRVFVKDLQFGRDGEDFILARQTCLARFFTVKIPRIANPLHRRK